MPKGKKGKEKVSVDFTGVDEGGGAVRVTPGDYAFKVLEVKERESSNDKPYLNWKLKGLTGAVKDKTIFHTTSLQSHALFNLRNTLLACKVEAPKSKTSLDLTKLKNLVLGATVDDDTYKGRTKSTIVDVFPITMKKGKMVKESLHEGDEDEFEDEDIPDDIDEDEYDLDEMDLEELTALAKQLSVKIPKKNKKDEDAIRSLLEEALEDEDDDDEDDEE